jgi:uncharacterized protein YjbI with pentapeptide repeats
MIINLIKNLLKKNYLGNLPTKALLILFVALLGTPTMAIAEKCPSNMKEMTQKYEQDGFLFFNCSKSNSTDEVFTVSQLNDTFNASICGEGNGLEFYLTRQGDPLNRTQLTDKLSISDEGGAIDNYQVADTWSGINKLEIKCDDTSNYNIAYKFTDEIENTDPMSAMCCPLGDTCELKLSSGADLPICSGDGSEKENESSLEDARLEQEQQDQIEREKQLELEEARIEQEQQDQIEREKQLELEEARLEQEQIEREKQRELEEARLEQEQIEREKQLEEEANEPDTTDNSSTIKDEYKNITFEGGRSGSDTGFFGNKTIDNVTFNNISVEYGNDRDWGMVFNGSNISHTTFKNSEDLPAFLFQGATLDRVSFENVEMFMPIFYESTFEDSVDFVDSILLRPDFSGVDLSKATFKNTIICEPFLQDAKYKEDIFKNATLFQAYYSDNGATTYLDLPNNIIDDADRPSECKD